VRHGYLLGAAVAVLVAGAAVALVMRGSNHPSGQTTKETALSPGAARPGAAVEERATPGPASPPSGPVHPSFDIVKVGPTGTAVIAGRAEPGSKVTIRDGDKVVGEVTTDPRGEWVFVPDRPMSPGDRLLSLEASDPKAGATVRSDETVALSISPPKPESKEETTLAVVLPRDGAGAARVLQRPDRSSPSEGAPSTNNPTAMSMDALEYDDHGRAVLSGKATPGATVQIYAGDQLIGTAEANPAGEWSATSNRTLRPGHVELRLDQLGRDARVVQRIVVPLARAAVAAKLSPGETYTVQRGNNLWQISRRAYGVGNRYLIIYSANLSQIRDPEHIYPGQVFRLPKP
jgi:nucleoid-associated protein YgaU